MREAERNAKMPREGDAPAASGGYIDIKRAHLRWVGGCLRALCRPWPAEVGDRSSHCDASLLALAGMSPAAASADAAPSPPSVSAAAAAAGSTPGVKAAELATIRSASPLKVGAGPKAPGPETAGAGAGAGFQLQGSVPTVLSPPPFLAQGDEVRFHDQSSISHYAIRGVLWHCMHSAQWRAMAGLATSLQLLELRATAGEQFDVPHYLELLAAVCAGAARRDLRCVQRFYLRDCGQWQADSRLVFQYAAAWTRARSSVLHAQAERLRPWWTQRVAWVRYDNPPPTVLTCLSSFRVAERWTGGRFVRGADRIVVRCDDDSVRVISAGTRQQVEHARFNLPQSHCVLAEYDAKTETVMVLYKSPMSSGGLDVLR